MSFRSIVAVLGVLAAALVVGRAAGLEPRLPGTTSSATAQQATLSILDVPGSVSAGGGSFQVRVWADGVTNLGAYEWQIVYNSSVIELTAPPESAITNGDFLGRSGRTVLCTPPILPPSQGLEPGNVRYSCGTTTALTVPGPNGSGLLSTISFVPVASGDVSIEFVCGALADPNGDPIGPNNVSACSTSITPTPGPSPTPTPTVPGGTPQPTATTPAGQTPAPTATSALPTATPVPQGPTPTPEPTPPPESAETVSLFSGCNPVVSTYRDGTTVQTLANAIAPPESLESMWRFVSGVWSAYSPAFPQASNLRSADFLDVVFLCEAAPGSFVRPLV